MSESHHYSNPIFIDTSPLLLLLVGNYNKELIGKVKRLKEYQPKLYEILIQFLTKKKVYVTPGVIAEVINLSKQSIGGNKFKSFIESNLNLLKKLGELHITKDVILETDSFLSLGYTDTSLLLAVKEKNGAILTADFPLFNQCKKLGMESIHINELDEYASYFK